MYTHLNWDSDFFGFPTAKIDGDFIKPDILENILNQLILKKYKLVYLFTDPSNLEIIKLIQKLEGKLVDEKIIFRLQLTSFRNVQYDNNIISYPVQEPNEELIELAIESGKYSRFRTDNCFSKGIYEKLYAQWITNSTLRLNAEEVFVYQTGNKIKGMITLSEKQQIGSIGLIAVAQDSQGLGIGKKLVNRTIQYYHSKGIDNLDVVTQNANKNACDFYKKIGFKILNIKNVYHFWLN
jgi:dTDP-4-amino-4,6-dideoxy-D-galactose acyltransferase